MNTHKLFAAAAIAALVAGTNLAVAQSGTSSGSTDSGRAPAGGSGPAATREGPTGGFGSATSSGSNAPSKRDSSPRAEGPSGGSSTQGKDESGAASGQRSGQSEMKKGSGDAQKSSQQGAQDDKSTTGVGGSGSLTSEKRSRIKETIVKSGNAPKVTNVNFSISVGTTVPRSVRLAAVPATVIEIYPAWRGYEYFIADDEIVIVDPKTMRIIAVIEA